MKLYTPIDISKSTWKINAIDTIITSGSCFAVNMGEKLQNNGWPVLNNKLGTVFNPISLAKQWAKIINLQMLNSNEFTLHKERYHHYDFYSSFNDDQVDAIVLNINKRIEAIHQRLSDAQCLIITFGTSTAYQLKSSGDIVANCHKMPQSNFNKIALSIEDMLIDLKKIFLEIHRINPQLKIILTVSPIRHQKDGLIENQLSKSKLRVLSSILVEQFEWIDYFPSYEIMMDELRDYRFYKPDLLHPTEQAVEYIWQRFMDTYFSDHAIEKQQDFQKLNKAFHHKIEWPKSKEAQQFINHQLAFLAQIKNKWSNSDVSKYEHHYLQFKNKTS